MKGKKTGGRKKGTPNKASLSRAAEQAANARASNQKTGLDVMIEIMNHFAGLGAKYQSRLEVDSNGVSVQVGDEKKSVQYLKLAADIAKDVAQYQVPRLQSTTLRPPDDGGAFVHRVVVEFV